jgi:transcriptional antiterminator RfaH
MTAPARRDRFVLASPDGDPVAASTGSAQNIAAAVMPHLTHDPQTPVAPVSRPLGRGWHVVRTNVHCEVRARLGIEALGFPVYLPCETRIVRHARRKIPVKRPLFPRYLFAAFDAEREAWGAIKTTYGVEYLLYGDPDVPARVPDTAIERLRRAEAAGEFDLTKPGASFALGASVRIEEGPFADMVGEVKRADSKHRVAVLLSFLQRTITVEVPAAMLRAVADRE